MITHTVVHIGINDALSTSVIQLLEWDNMRSSKF